MVRELVHTWASTIKVLGIRSNGMRDSSWTHGDFSSHERAIALHAALDSIVTAFYAVVIKSSQELSWML